MFKSHKAPAQEQMPPRKKHKKHHDASQFNDSVTYIKIKTIMANPLHPHLNPIGSEGSGSGSVIDEERGLILTCAHVASLSDNIQVRLGSGTEFYPATVLVSENDCDLAILQIDHPDFRSQAKAVTFGSFQPLGKKITVVGYPCTGEELTATSGTISGNEILRYSRSGAYNLASMSTAPTNPGNSGGPVFDSEGRQIGVHFQGMPSGEAEGAKYLIPMPVINHFLTMAYKAINEGRNYTTGVPSLPIEIQDMKSPLARAVAQMDPHTHTGVRVKSITKIAELGGLQVDDIILAIDGHRLENDGTIRSFPEICERLNYRYLILQKQMGEEICLKILRKGEELTLKFPLIHRHDDLKLIGRVQYQSELSFFIRHGMLAQVLTPNLVVCANLSGRVEDEDELLILKDKATPDQELVVINTIFSHPNTQSYDGTRLYYLVKSVNGKVINNLRDWVFALEAPINDRFIIMLHDGSRIVLPFATPEIEEQILKFNKYTKTHSDDLKPVIEAARASRASASSSANAASASEPTQRSYLLRPRALAHAPAPAPTGQEEAATVSPHHP